MRETSEQREAHWLEKPAWTPVCARQDCNWGEGGPGQAGTLSCCAPLTPRAARHRLARGKQARGALGRLAPPSRSSSWRVAQALRGTLTCEAREPLRSKSRPPGEQQRSISGPRVEGPAGDHAPAGSGSPEPKQLIQRRLQRRSAAQSTHWPAAPPGPLRTGASEPPFSLVRGEAAGRLLRRESGTRRACWK